MTGLRSVNIETLEPRLFLSVATIDATFGNAGVVTAFPSQGPPSEQAAILPDGNIVAAGNYQDPTTDAAIPEFVEYSPQGSLLFNVPAQLNAPRAVAITPNGEVLVLGDRLAEFNENGSLDITFGNDGIIALPAPVSVTQIQDTFMAVAPNGNIFIANGDVVAQYSSTGVLNTSFGNEGIVRFEQPAGGGRLIGITSLSVDGQGQPLIGYEVSGDYKYETQFAVVSRLTTTGAYDTGFAGTGTDTYGQNSDVSAEPTNITPLSDGGILIVVNGYASLLNSSGDQLKTPVSNQDYGNVLPQGITSITSLSADALIAAGNGINGDFITRLIVTYQDGNPRVQLDPTFGNQGIEQLSLSDISADAFSKFDNPQIVFGPDGNAIFTGTPNSSGYGGLNMVQLDFPATPTVTQSTFTARTPLRYVDDAGHHVALRLTGPGDGLVTFVSSSNDPVDITFSGTSSRSSFIVQTARGTTTIGTIEALILGRIQATKAIVDANAYITEMGAITVAGVSDATWQLNAQSNLQAVLHLGVVSNLALQIPQARLIQASSWTGDSESDDLSIDQLQSLQINGDFTANIGTNSSNPLPAKHFAIARAVVKGSISGWWVLGGPVQSIKIGTATSTSVIETDNNDAIGSIDATGTLSGYISCAGSLHLLAAGKSIDGAKIDVDGNLSQIRTPQISNSTIIAGLSFSAMMGLVQDMSQFDNQATIQSIVIPGRNRKLPAFSNSSISAPAIGAVQVGLVDESITGAATGFAFESLHSISYRKSASSVFHWHKGQSPNLLQQSGPFQLNLLSD
jgi:hypothetical protein